MTSEEYKIIRNINFINKNYYYYYILKIILYLFYKEKGEIFAFISQKRKKTDRSSRFGPSIGFGIIIPKKRITANLRGLGICEAHRRSRRRRRSSSLQLGRHSSSHAQKQFVPKTTNDVPSSLTSSMRRGRRVGPGRCCSFLLQGPAGQRRGLGILQIGR